MTTLTSSLSTSIQTQPQASVDSVVTHIREFLAFKLGQEEFGIDILCVQEIRSYEPPTRMTSNQPFILGVMNLRGVIVPIVDLRIKFNLAQVNYDTFTVVMVLNIGKRVVGMVVDGVSDVVTLTAEQLHPAPELTARTETDYLLAIGSLKNRMLLLLNIEKLLPDPDMELAGVTDKQMASDGNGGVF